MPVTFNISNYTKCLCPVCRVQVESDCIAAKQSDWRETRKIVGAVLEDYPDYPETYEIEAARLVEHEVGRRHGFSLPTKASMEELYCSIGETECRDLAGDKLCICGDCAVWSAAGLGTKYFCFQGTAG